MKGLIYKDLCLLFKQARMILLASAFAMLCAGVLSNPSGAYLMLYGGLLLGMVPNTLLSYEEREDWQSYVKTLPLSGKQIVGEKYLFGLIMVAFELVTAVLAMGVSALCGYVWPAGDMAALLAMVACLSLLDTVFVLPLSYRFGTNKGTIVFYLFIGVWSALVMVLGLGDGRASQAVKQANPAVLLAAVGVLYALSWRLAAAWYGRAGK